MDTAERALAEEARRNMDELLLTALRDGRERPASEIMPLVEAIASPFTDVGALPAGLDEEQRRKAELTNATNRLKHAGALQVQGTGAQRKLKLTHPPDWLVRDRQLLDQAEAEAFRQLLKLLSDGAWHLTDTLLGSLQDLQFPRVSAIGQFAVAYAALGRALREDRCIRQTSGRKGTIDYMDEVKLAGTSQTPEAAPGAPVEGITPGAGAADSPGKENGTTAGGDHRTTSDDSSTAQEGGPTVLRTGASGAEGVAEPELPSTGTSSPPVENETTSVRGAQADPQVSGDEAGVEGAQDKPGAGDVATETDADQAAKLQLQAGFVATGGGAEVVYIDIDKIDLDDEEDPPKEVVGLSQSIDNLGLLGLPGVRASVEERFRVVYGHQRLRDCKKKGWKKVPCIVLRVDDRTAELAAIDENLIRSELTALERGEYLLRRKQIYEEMHPQAARPKGGRPRKNSATVAPFSEDAAQRTKSSRRQVQLDLEIADKLTEATKKVLRSTEFADQTTVLAKLAKLAPREQLSAAKLLAKGQATSVQAATRIIEERRQGKGDTEETAEPGLSAPAVRPEGESERLTFEILTGDCRSLLPVQAPGRFRLILIDPSQNDGVDYGEGSAADQLPDQEYLAWVRRWLEACVPLLSEDGSLWFLTRDRYVHTVRDLLIEVGLHPQIWIKVYEPPGVGPPRGFHSSTLHLLHSTKAADQFAFYPEGLEQAVTRSVAETRALASLGCKLTDDVWVIPRLKAADMERIPSFPVQRRKALLEPVIRCATAAGDWVLDPFSGSATTGVVALEGGRNYLGIEKNVHFAELSRGRLAAATRVEEVER